MAVILLADDDDQFREMVRAMLERMGHTVDAVDNGNAALARVTEQRPDLLITDLIMPDKEGIELIGILKHTARDLPIIAMSGGGRSHPAMYLKMASTLGARAVLAKPFTFAELSEAVASALAPPERT